MARNWLAKVAAATLALAVLAGCGGAQQQTAQKAFTVGMATDMGGLNDDSFNAAAHRGLLKAEKELGIKINVIESKRQEDYETNFSTLMDQGSDLVWGIGFLMETAVKKMAEANPKQKFAIIDAVVQVPNVASVMFKEEEGSFLMGILAAKTTKSGKVAFIGGMDMPVIHRFEAGFKAGVKATNPSVEVITIYSNSFVDPNKGKSDALQAIGQGADVVFHAAGGTGQGVIEAAQDKNVYAIGVDSDQKHLAPNHVISSMMKRVDVAVFEISKQARDGKFPGGQVITLGLKDDGVGYSDTTMWEKMPSDTKALADKWAQAIKDGKVTVPNDPKTLPSWTAPKL